MQKKQTGAKVICETELKNIQADSVPPLLLPITIKRTPTSLSYPITSKNIQTILDSTSCCTVTLRYFWGWSAFIGKDQIVWFERQ